MGEVSYQEGGTEITHRAKMLLTMQDKGWCVFARSLYKSYVFRDLRCTVLTTSSPAVKYTWSEVQTTAFLVIVRQCVMLYVLMCNKDLNHQVSAVVKACLHLYRTPQ